MMDVFFYGSFDPYNIHGISMQQEMQKSVEIFTRLLKGECYEETHKDYTFIYENVIFRNIQRLLRSSQSFYSPTRKYQNTLGREEICSDSRRFLSSGSLIFGLVCISDLMLLIIWSKEDRGRSLDAGFTCRRRDDVLSFIYIFDHSGWGRRC